MSKETIAQVVAGETEAVKADIVLSSNVQSVLSEIRTMPPAEKIAALAKLTSYASAATEKIDAWINKKIYLVGVFLVPAQVKLEKPEIDMETGALKEYADINRAVIKFYEDKSLTGKMYTVGFASIAAESFFKNIIIPIFGQGDFPDGEYVPLIVEKGTCKAGQTYNFKVVG